MAATSTTSRRDRLVRAALTVFAQEGVDAASIKKIGRAAGVAPALIYHYFESKEALLAAVVERHGFLPQLRRMLTVPPTAPAVEVLPLIVRQMYELLTERADLVRVVMATSQTHPEMRRRMDALNSEAQTLLARYLRARIEAGELHEHNPHSVARMLLSTVVMWRLTDAPAAELDDAITALVAGLTAAPAKLVVTEAEPKTAATTRRTARRSTV
ncbi:TetR/AcrR family transcriptional regulator [Mycobacterium heidelbergense]|uniref:TetR/AcrR family transcriptional regulator n=1 Tax=Mycobacterium heidelbergense TaxID=53376 RepID=UPI003CED49CA